MCIYIVLNCAFSPRLTLVVCDSRGRKVLLLLDNPDIICRFYPGAMLENILPRLENLVLKYRPISCLITVGVNDLTYINREFRYVYPRVRDPFYLVNTIIKKMLYIHKSLLKLQPDLHVVYGGLNGVDLNRYNNWKGLSLEG